MSEVGARPRELPGWIPPFSVLAVLAAFLAGLVLVRLVPSAAAALALRSPLFVDPVNPIRLLTYSFVTPSLSAWVFMSLLTWAPAMVLQGRLDERWMPIAMAAGAVAGGVAFGIRTADVALAGGFVASYGLAGAAVGAFARAPGRFTGLRRAYVILVAVVVIAAALTGAGVNAAIVVSTTVGGVVGAARTRSEP